MTHTQGNLKRYSSWVDWLGFIIVALVVVLTWYFWAVQFAPMLLGVAPESSEQLVKLGQFGDLFGGINALFTALAFAGVILTALLQRRELSLQREELEETRAVLADQAKSLRRQIFEGTFFQMLRQQHELLASIVLRIPRIELIGRKAIAEMNGQIQGHLTVQLPTNATPSLEMIGKEYVSIYREHESHLGPYFRNLYHTFKAVDRSALDDEEKVLYANLIRAQLSATELELLSMNCLSEYGRKFKPLIEKYGVLKHLPVARIRSPQLKSAYHANAFLGAEERTTI